MSYEVLESRLSISLLPHLSTAFPLVFYALAKLGHLCLLAPSIPDYLALLTSSTL